MPGKRGGCRSGSGRKSTWRQGPCKTVKIPAALVDQVVAYARRLDAGEDVDTPTPPAVLPEAPAVVAAGRESAIKMVEEIQAHRRTIAILRADLEKERKRSGYAAAREEELTKCIQDALWQIDAVIGEHERGRRRGVTIRDARSIQLALSVSGIKLPESLPNQT